MKKIGRFFCATGFLVSLLALFTCKAVGQSSVSVEASVSETTIYTGERVNLSVKISGDFNNVSRPELPDFKGLRLLSNTPSTSRSYSFVNGQSSTSYTYTYSLIAQDKGSYTIPPVNITIDGDDHKTEPINIKVIDRNESANSSGSQKPDIFLRLEVSDKKPVTGQQIISNVVLYFKDGLEVNSYQPVPGWKAEGFWKEELDNADRPQASSTIIDGVRYRRARLLQFSLFPTKQGKLEISPYKSIVAVRSARSSNDPFSTFFGGMGNNQRQVQLETDPVTVNVQPLPANHNGEYLGAVGDYHISREVSPQNATVGESIQIKTTVHGVGNVSLVTKPDYKMPNGLEVYEPQESSDLNRKNHRISGTKTFTDVVIARSPGNYSIPGKKVSYFDPSKHKYITTTLPPLHFDVKANPNATTAASTSSSFPVQPITGLATWVTPTSTNLLSHWWLWAGIMFPLILLGIAYWQKTYSEKMSTDQAFARSQKASAKAHERLNKAVELSEQGNIKQAYNMLQKALTGFISDRLTMPEAGLSNQEYVAALEEHDIEKNLVKNVRMLLDKCASISYAPETSHAYLKSHVGLAESTLEKLKKVI
ncbi:MAG TPA: BatD family protein [Balneolaceae bacterium]|nr:BatD family protein [Balneolaceae bacterium]